MTTEHRSARRNLVNAFGWLLPLICLAALAAPAQAASGTWDRAWGKNVNGGGVFGICTVASSCQTGSATTALGGELNFPTGVAADAAGNVYVADFVNHRIQKFDSAGNFLRAWGKDVISGNVPTGFEICVNGVDTCKIGETATALGGEMNAPKGVDTDAAGNVYVADTDNERVQKFDSAGNFLRAWGKDVDMAAGTGFEICTVAASCQIGSDATALGGELNDPSGVATDAAGNVYITDHTNSRVQQFDSAGNFLQAWGKDVISSNVPTGPEICVNGVDTCKVGELGTQLGGELGQPFGLGTDAGGNVYVADRLYSRIQKFDSAGNFLRAWGEDVISGNVPTGFEICVSGVDTCKIGTNTTQPGGALSVPHSVGTDAGGNVYVADRGNNRIQKFDSAGNFLRAWGQDVDMAAGTGFEICTVAASCQIGSTATALGGELSNPSGVGTDAGGNVYVADSGNNRIQKFADPLPPPPAGGSPTTPTGQRAAALKKCKKKSKKKSKKARKKCKKKANLLPV